MKKYLKNLFCLLTAFTVALGSLSVSAATNGEAVLNRTQIVMASSNGGASLSFTAPESGFYKFYSTGNFDTIGYIIDDYGNFLGYSDDSDDDMNFAVYCYMQAGNKYSLMAGSNEENEIWFAVKVEKSDIESVNIDDITLYENVDSMLMYDYNSQTGNYDAEYMYYYYAPTFSVTLKNGTVLHSDESGNLEYEGQSFTCKYTDDQSYENEWKTGKHTVSAQIFGFSETITVTVEENPLKSVEFHDVTLYDDWDCLVIDENWEEILGIEITEPIKVFIYVPQYTATFKDGTVLRNNELGMIVYNGKILSAKDLIDDQAYENQWGIGEHTSQASFLGITGTFKVTVMPNPIQSVHFEDITLLKDWDYYYDYDYNSETEEYDLEWKHYDYTPSYTITLNDGTKIQSDENGSFEYDGKHYIFLGANDGQSYETPWVEGTYPVKVKIFGHEGLFNVTLQEMVSVSGDTNRDNSVDNRDYALLMQYINGWSVRIDVGACDVDSNDEVNNRDYALLMQYLNGWDVEI